MLKLIIIYTVILTTIIKQSRKTLKQRRNFEIENENSTIFRLARVSKISLNRLLLVVLLCATILPLMIYSGHYSFVLGMEYEE